MLYKTLWETLLWSDVVIEKEVILTKYLNHLSSELEAHILLTRVFFFIIMSQIEFKFSQVGYMIHQVRRLVYDNYRSVQV